MMIGALGEGDCTRAGAPVRRVRELDRHRPGAPVVRPARGRLPAARAYAGGPGLRPPDGRPRPDRRRLTPPDEETAMTEYRRILLDGAAVQRRPRTATLLVAGDGREVGVDDAVHLPPDRADARSSPSTSTTRSRTEEFMTKLPAAPTYFHKPVTALNAHRGAVVRPRGLQVAQLRGRDRHRHRPDLPQRLARARPATTSPATPSATTTGCTTSATPTPGSMLRVKGSDTLAPVGPGLVDRLGLPRQDPAHAGQRRGGAGGVDRRDGVGHALPRRRHRPHDHAVARRPALLRYAGELAPGASPATSSRWRSTGSAG